MTRTILPTRRPNVTITADWSGHVFTATLGFDPARGHVAEVFADTAKGGQMQATLADACVLISIALQHGIQPADLAKSMGVTPAPWQGGADLPASPIGAILAAICAVADPKGGM